MNRRELVLAVLAASEGRPYTPVQIQKSVFLITENAPDIVDEGPDFDFQPFDYGPFDPDVYAEAQALANSGLVAIAPSDVGRWNTYAASDRGIAEGRNVLASLPQARREYVAEVSEWVRRLSFTSLVKSIYDAYPEMRVNSIFRG
jgi:hypothetical protein